MKTLGDYSMGEASKILAESGMAIFPVSAAQPIQNLPLNICEFITKKIAENVCEKTNIHQTSPVSLATVTPFKPIPDVGLHKNRFRAVISDCVCSLNYAGAKKIFFLSSCDFFSASITKAVNDYKRKLSEGFSYEIISWQSIDFAEKKAAQHFENLNQFWRNEAAVFLLANELKGIDIPVETQKLPFSKEDFEKWKKRGADPEKLRKFSPDFRFSSWTGFSAPQTSFFEELCVEISKIINEKKL